MCTGLTFEYVLPIDIHTVQIFDFLNLVVMTFPIGKNLVHQNESY